MTTLNLIPAYGRDYNSVQSAQKAWAQGTSFELGNVVDGLPGGYASIRDLPTLREAGYRFVQIRFKCLSRVAIVKIGA